MRTIAKIIFAVAATSLCLCGCTKTQNVDLGDIEGDWKYTIADEGCTEDGSVHYSFLHDGNCQRIDSNYLDNSKDSDNFSVGKWSLSDNILTIDINGADDWALTRKSKDKILCQGRYHDCQYFLIRQKGTSYKELMGVWQGEESVTMVFSADRKCEMMSGISGLLSANKLSFHCFWRTYGASFNLVDSDMQSVYFGRLENGAITLKNVTDGKVITLQKILRE